MNSEDKHIKVEGTETKVYAKNLMVGDDFILRSNRIGTIVKVKTKVIRKNRKYTFVTSFTVRLKNKKTFRRMVDGKAYVHIMEYPNTRFYRRNMSRLSIRDRYTIVS